MNLIMIIGYQILIGTSLRHRFVSNMSHFNLTLQHIRWFRPNSRRLINKLFSSLNPRFPWRNHFYRATASSTSELQATTNWRRPTHGQRPHAASTTRPDVYMRWRWSDRPGSRLWRRESVHDRRGWSRMRRHDKWEMSRIFSKIYCNTKKDKFRSIHSRA